MSAASCGRGIVFVDASPALGGASRVLLTIASALEAGPPHALVCNPAGPLEREFSSLRDRLEIAPMSMPVLTVARGAAAQAATAAVLARNALALTAMLRRRRPALVYANGLMAALYALTPARLLGIPLLWHCHEMLSPGLMNRAAVRAVVRSAVEVICVSAAARARLMFFGAPEGKCHVVYNAAPEALKPSQGAPGSESARPTLLAAGTITPQKGQDVLIEAMSEVAAHHPDVILHVAGEVTADRDEPYRATLHARVRELGLAHAVEFLGFRRDVRERMARASVVVHPATSDDSFPLVILEALALGKPIVATSVGGIPELVADGVSGLLVAPGQPRPLARAVLRVLADADLRESLRVGALRAAGRFTRERMLAGMNGLLAPRIGYAPLRVT